MLKYAIVNSTGIVENIIVADDISQIETTGVQVIETDIAGPGWLYKDGEFLPAPEPELTHNEMQNAAGFEKQLRLREADAVVERLKDAVELGMATDEEATLYTAWRKYRVVLNRVDILKAPDIEWPTKP
ncbi:tail fiber assembly protein [Leminorella grimontii]|uniref:tail fiber assembly protein n=1 Tax=Leminorella grimontii TaxID=82981 RepID=UPI0032202F1A